MRDATGRLTVLISGRGSNLRAFLQAQQSGELDGEINAVISNRPQAPGNSPGMLRYSQLG